MTYAQLIEKTRMRGYEFLEGTRYFEPGVVYDALHDAIRHVFHITKQNESSATLSLVADTRDYTISSAIATNVDSIIYVHIDTGSIEPLVLREFQEQIFFDVDDEDDITAGTPIWYRVHNDVMRVYPTPNTAFSATVYYTIKVAPDFYTTAIGATTITLKDEYIEPVIYEALAILSEGRGDFSRAESFRGVGRFKLEEARDYVPVVANGVIQYRDTI